MCIHLGEVAPTFTSSGRAVVLASMVSCGCTVKCFEGGFHSLHDFGLT